MVDLLGMAPEEFGKCIARHVDTHAWRPKLTSFKTPSFSFMLALSPLLIFVEKAKGDVRLFFQHPHQLLSIFTDLEDENLKFIQECREEEGNLEKIRTSIREVSKAFQYPLVVNTIRIRQAPHRGLGFSLSLALTFTVRNTAFLQH